MLLRKMIRDLWKQKGTYLASMLLIIVGILVYNMFSMLHESFTYSLDKYYEDYHFADGTLKVTGMPRDAVNDLIKIKEIRGATGRIEKRVRLLEEEREAVFQFISYDGDKENPLNDIELLGGRMPNSHELEIIMGNNYFKALDMELGEQLPVIINGKGYNLRVVGYGRSPEFIYAKKNNNELVADPKSFDLVFMPYSSMNEIFGFENQINNVAFSLYRAEDFETAKREIKETVNKYGVLEISSREDQISHATVIQKLDGMRSMTTALPVMFLLISGIMIYIVLRRIIQQERTQIGVLKAFGIRDYRILAHYISYALIIGLIGGIIGAFMGRSFVPGLIDMMGIAYNMPINTAGLYQKYMINSLVLALLFALVSGYAGAKNCLKLEPADAMRPPMEEKGRAGILDRFYWLIEKFDIKVKLALRNIIRNKGRSFFILFGISVTAALLCFPMALSNMYDKLLLDQFTKIEVYDMKISLNQYLDRKTIVRELENKEGISVVEPMMLLPVEIFNNWKSEESAIISLPLDSKLYNLYDSNDQLVSLKAEGLMLSHWMAKSLGIAEGDYVGLKSPLFRNNSIKKIKVTKIIPQYIGSNGYMNIESVKGLLDGQDLANVLMVKGTKEALAKITEDYNESEMIATFDFREKIAQEFAQFMQQTTAVIWILVLVGLLMGFAVTYVSLMISLSERNRELATMLVMGMSEKEVHQVLIIEQFVISVFGIMMGLPLGKALLTAFAEISSTENFAMPSSVPMEAMAFSVVTTIFAIIIPQVFGRRKIGKIIVTEALNARE